MEYMRELEFMKKVLRRQRIKVRSMNSQSLSSTELDFGLRQTAGLEYIKMEEFVKNFGEAREKVIYKVKDTFKCAYIMLVLPEPGNEVLMLGPYTDAVVTKEHMMEQAARFSVPPEKLKDMEECYANIPALSDEGFLLSMVYAFAEFIWSGSGEYEVVDINEELTEKLTPIRANPQETAADDMMVAMRLMEQRYAWENELMLLVARGQSSRAEMMISDMANLSFRQRLADPVRNMKNYCIICNTLMRKAAQQGGVHPMYLDSVSSAYAAKIEAQTNTKAISELIAEMIPTYCRLVKKYSTKDYSPHVRRAMLLIDSQLSGELGLKKISEALDLNPSYLSNLFKKETGTTLTAYISSRRMEQAGNLLRNTGMQVQDVAIYCGVPDANYFSKLFKKETGYSPLEYRDLPLIDL